MRIGPSTSTLGTAMRASATGLSAERFRMDVISANLANSSSTMTPDAMPYRRRDVVLRATENGVQVSQVVEDQTPFPMRHEPGNQMADANGDVLASNVEPLSEMVNMITASRAYEANVAAFNTAKGMVKSALNIGKV